jgi:glycosyltransferase involved in cell wall biosynthesis
MEKRLVEIWLRLAPKYQTLHLIVSKQTYIELQRRPDLDGLSALNNRIVLFDPQSGRWPAMMLAILRVICKVPRGATVHYLLNAPPLIDRLLGHRMIFSWVSNFCPRPGRTRVANTVWLTAQAAFLSAHQLDILTPSVAESLRRNLFLARKINVTAGGSFANFNHFYPDEQKKDEVVFLGRTEARKNALAFVQSIPLIAARLAESGRSARFLVYGAPAGQEKEIAKLLASETYRGIAVERAHTPNPAAILASAKVFVSLQIPSNYPSKSLVEAMGCGCIPVINASGDSELMANETLASYIPSDFTLEQLAKAVTEILLLEDLAFAARSRSVRMHAIKSFRIERQEQYFASLWKLENNESNLIK